MWDKKYAYSLLIMGDRLLTRERQTNLDEVGS